MPFDPMSLILESVSPSTMSESAPNPYALRHREKSFFVETIEFLTEMNLEYHEATRGLYCTMVEAAGGETDVRVIHEGFGDFFDSVKKIIEKFLNFIKSLFMRFLTMINNLIGRDKYILNHKDELTKFSTIHEFDITGYIYTINSSVPVIDAKAAFTDEFVFDLAGDDNNTLAFNGPSTGVNSRLETIRAAGKTLSLNLENEAWYDNFRASVLNSDTPISKDDFADKLFAEFRNGESISEEITITNYEVTSSLRRFKDAKSDIDKAKKLKATIDSQYNSVKKSVEKMVTANRSGNATTGTIHGLNADGVNNGRALSSDEILAMDAFTKAKTAQIQEMSNIHALAFAAKLDAMTDCYKQDKNILFKALSRVQSTKEV